MKQNKILTISIICLLALCSCNSKLSDYSDSNLKDDTMVIQKKGNLNEILLKNSFDVNQLSKIWFSEFGEATSTIYSIDSSYFVPVLNKFDFEFEEDKDFNKDFMNDFYLSLFLDEDSLISNYMLGISKEYAYLKIEFESNSIWYTSKIETDVSTSIFNYLCSLPHSLSL